MLIERFINENKYSIKCPYSMTPKGICIHNTANDASASNEVSYMGNNNEEVSYHIAIDDIESIQAIPFNRNTWHSGDGGNGQGNRNYISIEICYSKSGGERFTKAESRAVKEVADLCRKFGFTVDNIKAHR
ncbi:MAG: peptidoglycan recognition protein family protein, partial [Anaeroplasmataceae bacterium]